jgi:5-methylcytosine-specific restriction endonuclease McrA
MKITPNGRKKVFAKYQGKCSYCGTKPKKLTLDHIKPVCEGGTYGLYNLIPACYACNQCKGDKTVEEFREAIRCRLEKKGQLKNYWKEVVDRFEDSVVFYFEDVSKKPTYITMGGFGYSKPRMF